MRVLEIKSGVDAVDGGGHLGYVNLEVGSRSHGRVTQGGLADQAMVTGQQLSMGRKRKPPMGLGRKAMPYDQPMQMGSGDQAVMMDG
jgi:hypothetical protein